MAPRVLVVVGTRPEAIKMAPVVEALRAHAPDVETLIALSGQHDELVDSVLEVFGLQPDADLGIMTAGQSVADVLRAGVAGLRGLVRELAPDALLVEGDTATVYAGALVGYYEGVKVGHVEAGLRSGDWGAPFPEEIFRWLTGVFSHYHFAPTARARDALLAERVPAECIHLTGNTVVDALLRVSGHERPVRDEVLRRALDGGHRVVLLTAHRRESFGAPIREIFSGVLDLVEAFEDVEVIYPVHPNPNVLGPAREMLGSHERVHLTEPVDYLDLVSAMRAASLILTDSGGIQEEAPTFGTPLLVLREVTERPEGVEAGVAELVGPNRAKILERGSVVLGRGRTDGEHGPERATAGGSAVPEAAGSRPNPYGDGRAAERIADIVVADLTGRERETRDWTPER